MSVIAIALLAALNGAPPQDQPEPRVERRSEIRIVTRDGQGPGRLDADDDGVVTREEFSAPMASAFNRLDKDHDGRLSTEELAAGPGGPDGPGVHVFTSRDGGPGAPLELQGGGEGGPFRIFTTRIGPDGPPPDGPGPHHIFVRRFDGPDGRGEMDRDGDGKVSQDKFLLPLRDAFARMDADHDGFLDEGEDRPAPPSAD